MKKQNGIHLTLPDAHDADSGKIRVDLALSGAGSWPTDGWWSPVVGNRGRSLPPRHNEEGGEWDRKLVWAESAAP